MFARKVGQNYVYNEPIWEGSALTCTLSNLEYQIEYCFVVRAFQGNQESADSNEVTYLSSSNAAADTDTTAPSWNGATTGIGLVMGTDSSDAVRVEFDTAADDVDGANLRFNVYYAESGSWSATDWTNNSVIANAQLSSGSVFTYAVNVSGLANKIPYTFGVRVEDQSGNEDENTETLKATPTVESQNYKYGVLYSNCAVASSEQASGLEAAKAVDGESTTRWSSHFSDDQWIYVDLGSIYPVSKVILDWETAYASQYAIQVSTNATTWTTVYTEYSGNGKLDEVSFTAIDARYVRMQGLKRGTVYGYSLHEFEVYGTAASDSLSVLTTLKVAPSIATLSIGSERTFSASGFDQYDDAYPVSVSWSVSGGGSIDDQGVFVAATVGGPFTITAQAEGVIGTATVTVVGAESQANLALKRSAVASSEQASGLEAAKAVDGESTTRWSSHFSDDQWIYVDLGSIYPVSKVILDWETAYASQYAIQVSTNATTWTTVYTEYSGNGKLDEVSFTAIDARYVRMQGLKRGTVYGYSLHEFEVYGTAASDSLSVLTTLKVAPSIATLSIGSERTFSASGFDQYDDAYPVSVSWSVSGGGSIDDQGVFVAATVGGPFTITAQAEGVIGTATVTVVGAESQANLALKRSAVASSEQASGLEAAKAVDGESTTRWSSHFSDDQWIYVDLGSIYPVSKVILDWETAYASQYAIQVSTNATTWTTVYTEYSGNGKLDEVSFTAIDARYVRMQGLKRGTVYGYSLHEFEVYGTAASDSLSVLTTLKVAPSIATLSIGSERTFSASGFDQYDDAYPVSVSWSVSGGGSIDDQGVFVAATVGGPFTITAQAEGVIGTATVTVVGAESQANLALKRSAVASSEQASGLEAAKAVDGESTTRWSSHFSDDQWIYVDLGSIYPVSKVILDWETAYASQYAIQVSTNATTWTTVYTEYSGNGKLDEVSFTAIDARYVRMQGLKRGTVYGYSLFDFEVYP